MNLFARVIKPAPILNTPDFRSVFGGRDGSSLQIDPQGLVRATELICFENTKLQSVKQVSESVWEVVVPSYCNSKLFVDSRFAELEKHDFPDRKPNLPKIDAILSFLYAQVGLPYIWGGNYNLGVREMLELYPPSIPISNQMKMMWSLQGHDCSGLLYQATDGFTPRNTSSLIQFGTGIPIEGLSLSEIESGVKPLDLLVWKGHVIIALDGGKTIESRLGNGVVISSLRETLERLLLERKGMNSPSSNPYFLLRRWF